MATAVANQPQASATFPPSLTWSFSVSGTVTGTWTATLWYATNAAGPFIQLPSVAGSTSTTGTTTTAGTTVTYGTPTTSYYYQVQVTGGGITGTVTSTSLYFYSPYQGPQGTQGIQGVAGSNGGSGPTGPQGAQGLQGLINFTGSGGNVANYLITTSGNPGTITANSGLTYDGTTLNLNGGNMSTTGTVYASSTSAHTLGSVTFTNGNMSTAGTVYASSTSAHTLGSVTFTNGAISAAGTVTVGPGAGGGMSRFSIDGVSGEYGSINANGYIGIFKPGTTLAQMNVGTNKVFGVSADNGNISSFAGVPASTTLQMLTLTNTTGADAATLRIGFNGYAANVQTAIDSIQNSAGNWQAALSFKTNTGGGLGEALYLSANQNVGVGTNSPTCKFSVYVTTGTHPNDWYISNAWNGSGSNGGNSQWAVFGPGANLSQGAGIGISYNLASNIGWLVCVEPAHQWRPLQIGALYTNFQGNAATSGGAAVGIGYGLTTPPAYTLDVNGGTRSTKGFLSVSGINYITNGQVPVVVTGLANVGMWIWTLTCASTSNAAAGYAMIYRTDGGLFAQWVGIMVGGSVTITMCNATTSSYSWAIQNSTGTTQNIKWSMMLVGNPAH